MVNVAFLWFCCFRSVAINNVHKLQIFRFIFAVILPILSRHICHSQCDYSKFWKMNTRLRHQAHASVRNVIGDSVLWRRVRWASSKEHIHPLNNSFGQIFSAFIAYKFGDIWFSNSEDYEVTNCNFGMIEKMAFLQIPYLRKYWTKLDQIVRFARCMGGNDQFDISYAISRDVAVVTNSFLGLKCTWLTPPSFIVLAFWQGLKECHPDWNNIRWQ